MNRIEELESKVALKWKQILEQNSFIQNVLSGTSDRKLYADYLVQTYHYTSHNTKNQASVISNVPSTSPRWINYIKFCLSHAGEEAGHEYMAYHDLKALGYDYPLEDFPSVNPSTEALIAYLYRIAQTGNPLRRLGYSFWAENSYKYFGEVMMSAVKNMQLTPAMMTFFNEHGDIDQDHYIEICRMITRFATTDEDWLAIEEVALTSLELTASMLTEINHKYQENL